MVEAAVILGFSCLPVFGARHVVVAVCGGVGRKEGAAAHAGVAVSAPRAVNLKLKHFLFGNVVGNHAARRALGGQFRQIVILRVRLYVVLFQNVNQFGEGRRNPIAAFVFNALVALAQNFLYYKRQVRLFLLGLRFVQVHKDRDKGRLAVCGHQGHYLVLNRLNAASDFVAKALLDDVVKLLACVFDAGLLLDVVKLIGNLFSAHVDKGRQVGQRYALAAVLARSHLRDDLRGDVAGGGEGVRAVDFCSADDSSVLKHVLQIDQVAVVHVLRKVVRVVKVNQAFLVGLGQVFVKQKALGDVLADLAGHVVALHGNDGGIFV